MLQPPFCLRVPVMLSAFATTWLAIGTAHGALEQHWGTGSESCPSQPQAMAMVIGDEPPHIFDDARVVLAVKREGNARWIAQISVKLADGFETQRTIALRGTCRDLVLASAVAIRLALNVPVRSEPRAFPLDSPPKVAATTPETNLVRAGSEQLYATPVAPPPTAPLQAKAVNAPPPDQAASVTATAAPPAQATQPQRASVWPAWEASVGGNLLAGAAPTASPAVSLALARLYANSSLGAEITYAAPARGVAGAGHVEATSALLAALPCWQVHALALCAPVAAGVLVASAPDFANVRTRSAPLFSAGLRLGVHVLRMGPWQVRLQAAASAHLVRPRLSVDDVRLWTLPAGNVSVGIAIGRIFF